jgi:predicted dehydrogenase
MKPARAMNDVEVGAVAARDRSRAEAFAARWGVPVVHDSYDGLLADPSLDAVYIPLPNGLHAQWMLAALQAGKHVLCEKPFTSNAAQAREVAAAAAGSGLVVMEAFHYRYHPLARRMSELVRSGELGRIQRVETVMCFPLPRFSDIRYDFSLAGGALMDVGCYALHALRLLTPGTPEVTAARALTMRRDRRIDRAMTAQFSLPDGANGATGEIRASLWSSSLLGIRARAVGERGTLTVTNHVAPQLWSRFTVTVDGQRRRERVNGEATYVHQLRAFAAAVRGEPANLTPPSDSVVTMSLIDDIYTAAGLPLRG